MNPNNLVPGQIVLQRDLEGKMVELQVKEIIRDDFGNVVMVVWGEVEPTWGENNSNGLPL